MRAGNRDTRALARQAIVAILSGMGTLNRGRTLFVGRRRRGLEIVDPCNMQRLLLRRSILAFYIRGHAHALSTRTHVATGIGLRIRRRSTADARVAVSAGQRKEVLRNPKTSMFFRRESPGADGSAVAVDLPGMDKRQ